MGCIISFFLWDACRHSHGYNLNSVFVNEVFCLCLIYVYKYIHICIYSHIYVYIDLYKYLYIYMYIYIHIHAHTRIYILYIYIYKYIDLYIYMYMYIHIYIYIYMFVWVCVYTYTYVYIYIYVYYIYTYMCVCVSINVHICEYTHAYIYMYIYLYIYTYDIFQCVEKFREEFHLVYTHTPFNCTVGGRADGWHLHPLQWCECVFFLHVWSIVPCDFCRVIFGILVCWVLFIFTLLEFVRMLRTCVCVCVCACADLLMFCLCCIDVCAGGCVADVGVGVRVSRSMGLQFAWPETRLELTVSLHERDREFVSGYSLSTHVFSASCKICKSLYT